MTITDDDDTPAVSLALSASSVRENGGSSVVTAALSAASSEAVTVTVSATPVSPAASEDFTQTGTTLTIAAGETTSTGTVTLTAVDNDVVAATKQLTVSGSLTGGHGVSAPASRTLWIFDDDSATLGLEPVSVRVAEGGAASFAVTLSKAAASDVTFSWETAGGTATAGSDYTAQPATAVTIAAGDTTASVEVPTAVDALVEGPERFTVSLSPVTLPPGVSLGTTMAEVTIEDDDRVTASMEDVTVSESAGAASIAVTLAEVAAVPVVLTYETSDGSAAAGSDYTAASGNVTIPAGATTQNVSVTVLDDGVDEPNETFAFTLSDPRPSEHVVLSDATATVTITDDEATPTVSLATTPSSISENGGESTVTATLSAASSDTVEVTVSAAPVPPAVSGDFIRSGTTLTIDAGQTASTGTVTVSAVDNAVDAPDKAVTVSASVSGGNGVRAPPERTLAITDDEATPIVSLVLTPSSVGENGGSTSVTATLSAASSEAVMLTVSAAAVAPAVSGDFTRSGTTLTIAAGATTSTGAVTITAVDNAVDAADKAVTVSASVSGGNGVADPSSQTLTITDDEGSPTVALVLTPSSISENGGSTSVTATLSTTSSEAVEVTVSAAPAGPAVQGDFAQQGTTLTIAAGETASTGTVTLTAVDNAVVAPDKTVTVSATVSGEHGVGAPPPQSLTITNDDSASLSFDSASVRVTEGGRASFAVTLSKAVASDVTFSWQTADGTAAAGSDYTAQAATSVRIPAGDRSATLEVQTAADAVAEGAETFTATISAATLPAGVTFGTATSTATITDDDTATLAFDPASVSVTEGGEVSFTVALSKEVASGVTFGWQTADGTARSGADYTAQTTTAVTIPAGATSAALEVQTAADVLVESDETFDVRISASSLPPGVTVGTARTATATIVDDDTATLAFDPSSVTVAEGGTASFTVRLSRQVASDVAFSWRTADGTADGDDYTAQATTEGKIPAGSTSVTLNVQTKSDGVAEGDETFTATISATGLPNGVALGSGTTATATIVDDDTATLAFDPATVSVAEGGTASFTVMLSKRADEEVQFSWRTADGTAGGDDYTAQATTEVEIPAGRLYATLDVQTQMDGVTEGDETFTATISATGLPDGVTLGNPTTATATIVDADTATLAFSSTAVSVTEGGRASLTVTLSQAASSDVTFSWQTADGTAGSSDYTGQASTEVTISAGARSATLEVQTIQDTVVEGGETFTATLSAGSLPTGVRLGTDKTATVTITDDDSATVSLVLSSSSIGENGGSTTVTAALSAESSADVTLTVSAAAVSPAESGDFTLSTNKTLTISAGSTTSTGTVTVTGVDNAVDAPDKSVTVSATASGGHGVSAPSDQTLTITDDEGTPTVSLVLSPSTVSEDGGSSTVTATLSAESSAEVTLTVSASAVSPAVAGDFTLAGSTLTISAGSTTSTGTVTVTGVDNAVDAPDKSVTVSATVSGGHGVSAPSDQTLTITDDEGTPTVTLGLSSSSISENGGSTTVTATLSAASSADVTLTVSASAVSPATSSDFTLSTNKTLTVSAGSTTSTGSVTVTGVDNAVDAPDKSVTVSATVSGGHGVSAPSSQTLTITDDEGTPTVSLVLSPSSVSEDGGSATVTATLSAASSADVTLTVSASAVSPAVSGDFTLSTNKTLTISAGSTTSTGTVTVTGVDNAVDAPDKSVTVSATASGGNGVSAPSSQTLTITDDEGTPTVSLVLSSSSISENGGSATVTATLSAASGADVTLTVSASAVSPAVSGDFTLSTNKTLTISAGSKTSTGSVTVTGVDNAVDAPDKSVTVSATVSGGHGVSAPSSQTLTITDDEGTPTVSLVLSPSSVSEDGGSATVTATLSAASSADVTLTVSASAVSPAVSGDFTLSTNKTLTISAGSTTSTGTVTVTGVDNAVDAPDKSVTVSATASGGNGVSAPSSQTLTITDDEGTPTLTLALSSSSISENGGSATVTATLSAASGADVTLTVSASAVSPAVSGDFTLSTNKTLTISAGSTTSTGSVTVTGVDNTVDAPDKSVTVSATVSGGHGVSAPSSQTLTITDDEGTPTVSLVLSPSSVSEDGGSSTVTATLSAESSADVTLTVSASAVSPAVSGDFTLSTNKTLTISAGSKTSTGSVTVTGVDNAVDAPDKSVTVSATVSGGNGVSAPSSQTLTITDDEGTPTVSLGLSSSSISENGGSATVTATLSAASGADVTLTVSASAVSPATSSDFTLSTNKTLTISAGSKTSTGSVTVTGVDNTVDAPDKSVTVSATVSGGNGVSAPSSQTLTITDDEGGQGPVGVGDVTLSVSPATVSEDAGATPVTVTATLTQARTAATVVTVAVAGGTASADDFEAVSPFELTVAATELAGTATFTLTPIDDTEAEGAETVSVTATTAEPGLTVVPAELTITDDDEASNGVTLSVDPSTLTEGAGATEIRVNAALDGGPRTAATLVTVTVAEAEHEYALSQSVFDIEIPESATGAEKTLTLNPVDDADDEPDLWVPISGTNGQLPVKATGLTLEDDDEANRPPTFDRTRYEFDLEEHRSGRDVPVVLGTVAASDLAGDRLRYALLNGDRARFTVSESGVVSYIGEGEDFETGPREFDLEVTAEDELHQATVDVLVRVVDVPEAPTAADDRAETPEDTPKVIDVLSNDRDPDGDRLRVVSVSAPENGTATVVSGGVRYAPALNWHGEDRFTYTVADPGGLTATATVTVTVTPVNDPPEAVDDEAETLEDVAAVVDVLANDTDVDGDPLRVVSVGPARHGTTGVAGGVVRYASELNWYGTDRFTYTIADPGGLTATATVTMTVLPVNDPPEAVGVIPDQALEEGGAPVTVDLTPYFTDVDGDVLTYEAVSSDETAVTTAVSGATLTLTAVVTGAATVTVTAADVEGLTATQTFGVRVGDRLVKAVDDRRAGGAGPEPPVERAHDDRPAAGNGWRRAEPPVGGRPVPVARRVGPDGRRGSGADPRVAVPGGDAAAASVADESGGHVGRPAAAAPGGGGHDGRRAQRHRRRPGSTAAGNRRAAVVRRGGRDGGCRRGRTLARVGPGRPAVVSGRADRGVGVRRRPADRVSGSGCAVDRALAGGCGGRAQRRRGELGGGRVERAARHRADGAASVRALGWAGYRGMGAGGGRAG